MLSLLDIDHAMTELHRVMAAGARLVHLCPGPVGGHSPADPLFDPFWATVSEAGIPVVFHTSNSGYAHFYGNEWGENPDNPSHQQSPLQWALCNTERPLVDTMIAITLHNLFGRHPDVKIISIENGSNWLPALLKTVDKAAALGRRRPMIGGTLPDRPSEALTEHLYICPFPEDDVHSLVNVLGADHVLFGSDWPHPEGLAQPRATTSPRSPTSTTPSPARCCAPTPPTCSGSPTRSPPSPEPTRPTRSGRSNGCRAAV